MIPLLHPIFSDEEKQILSEVVDSRIIASGKYVGEFEKACAEKWGTKYAVCTSSGTTALHALLLACSIGRNDKVITTPFTFIATSNSILYTGARPVFADIDPATYNISPDSAEYILKRNKGIKAILLVHLYGTPCNMDDFIYLAKKYKAHILEDCAQSQSAMYNNKFTGSIGLGGTFSFYATKNMTTGEGGVVTTDSTKIDRILRKIINHGRKTHDTYDMVGYNFRLTNLAAAIGLVQIKKLDEWNKKRRANAGYLDNNLKGIDFLDTPKIPKHALPVYHQYTVRVKGGLRKRFSEYLKSKGISSGVYYPYPINAQEAYKKLGYKNNTCPNALKASMEVLSLPVHPALSKSDLNHIVNSIKDFKSKA